MAAPNFASIQDADLTKERVKHYIEYGQLLPKIHEATGRVGVHYKILRDVADTNGNLVKGFYFCSVCESVLQVNPSNGTTPLIRHAKACESK